MRAFLAASGLMIALSAPVRAQDKPAGSPPTDAGLTPQILYQFLLAEIAGQRGQLGFSAGAFADLAKTTRDPRIARRAAEIALHARQLETALASGRLWLELEPDNPAARQMMAALYVATNRGEELSGLLARDLETAGPRLPQALLGLNRTLGRHPDKRVVLQLVERLTTPYDRLPEAHFARAQAAGNAQDAQRALGAIERALELRPGWEMAALFKAQLLPRGPAQTAFLGSFLTGNPGASDARLAYARGLVAEKRFEESRREFRRLLESNPENPDILYAVGILSLQVGDAGEGESQLKKLVELGKGEVNPARFYLGQIAEEAKRTEDALRWYDEVVAGEHLMTARLRAVQLLSQQNRIDEARARLKDIQPDDDEGRQRLILAEAQLLRDAGRHREAWEFLEDQLARQPEQTDLLYETALAAEKIDRWERTEALLRRLIELKPDSAQAYNALGYSLAERNIRLEEARQLIEKALALKPDDPFILDSQGWVLFRLGRHEEALALLQRAHGVRPDPEIAAHIGEVQWVLGRRDDALKTWREAAREHPKNDVLAATIKRFSP